MRVLVTGATGLVGLETVDWLRRADVDATGTSRRGSREGDVIAWDIGANYVPPELKGPWDAIVHTAADTRWTMPLKEAERANVATIVALTPLVGPSTHVVHVSTAYAVGLRDDVASCDPADYRNSYEWSKAAAERRVREAFPHASIVRPPLIVGRREDGRAARFAGMYTILRGIVHSTVPAIVGEPYAFFDVIPVDDLARLLTEVARGEPRPEPLTIAGGTGAPRVEPMLELVTTALNEWRAECDAEPFDPPRVMAPDSWHRFLLPFARDHLSARQLRILDLLANFQPYLALSEPLHPTHHVPAVEPALAASVRYWADTNPVVASLAPRPWAAA